MTVDNETESTKAIAAVVNSKAAEKLSGAVDGLVQLGHKIVDYTVGPKRIGAVVLAKSNVALQRAKTDADIERIRVETGNYYPLSRS